MRVNDGFVAWFNIVSKGKLDIIEVSINILYNVFIRQRENIKNNYQILNVCFKYYQLIFFNINLIIKRKMYRNS